MLGLKADVVAYGANGQLVLIAEIVNVRQTSREWAAKFRCNLLADGFMPPNTFFLFATPHRFYLWKNGANQAGQYEPDYEIDPTPFLRPVYERIGLNPSTIHKETFEIIVTSLLSDLLDPRNNTGDYHSLANAFSESGLTQTLAGGRLDIEVPV